MDVKEDDEVKGCGSSGNSVSNPSSSVCEKISDRLYLLYEPEEGVKIVCDILFFHGLRWKDTDDDIHVSTWRSRDPSDEVPWPKKWIPMDVPGARILLVSYDSSITRDPRSGNSDLFLVTEMIVNEFLLAVYSGKVGRGGRPVILVGHCVGGLVVKSFCVRVANLAQEIMGYKEWKRKAGIFLKSIEGIFFYATPHQGFDVNQLREIDHEAISLPRGNSVEVVDMLSSSAARLHQEFEAVQKLKQPPWSCSGIGEAYETELGQKSSVKLVNEASAKYGETFSIVNEDHISICRPSDEKSSSYQSLLNLIKKVLKMDQENSSNLSSESEGNDGESEASISSAESLSKFQNKERSLNPARRSMAFVAEHEGASASTEKESDVPSHGEQPSYGNGSREGEQAERVMDDEEVEVQELRRSIKDLIGIWGIKVHVFDQSGTVEEIYGDVVCGSDSRLANPRVRSGACLRLLQAIGNCQTLNALTVNVDKFPSSAQRAKALLSPLKANPALHHLEIFGDWEKASKWMVSGLLEVIRCAPGLRCLTLSVRGMSDQDKVKGLADALLLNPPSLESLTIRWEEEGYKDLLIRVFSGPYHNQSIRTLHFNCKVGLSVSIGLTESLIHVLSTNQSLKVVEFGEDCVELMSVDQWREIGRFLVSNTSLQILKIEISARSIVAGDSGARGLLEKVREVLDAANAKRDPIIYIRVVKITYASRHGNNTFNLWKDVLTKFRSLQGVCLEIILPPDMLTTMKAVYLDLPDPLLPEVLDVLEQNSSSFQLLEVEIDRSPQIWERVFRALRKNTIVTHLVLKDRFDQYDHFSSFRALMSMLQVNFTLRTVDYEHTRWKWDGTGPHIDAALQRKVERPSYFATLRHNNLKLPETIARTGRLFLCGAPHSGKTRLRKTMMARRNKSWLGNKMTELAHSDLWRTTGIEVDFLQDDENMQISMWDLAGQEMFRTLQDVLFPRGYQPYIFLFVFSPYDEVKKEDKPYPEVSLREELEDWSRFVVSNSRVGSNKPQMIVVVTHKDKVSKPSFDWALTIVEKLQTDFQGSVDILFKRNFYVNAYKGKHVSPVLHQVLTSFQDFFYQTRTTIVPQVCSMLISALPHPTQNIQKNPIWSIDRFYDFCYQSVKHLNLSEGENMPGREVWDAIAMYLHAVGSIVLIPESDLVVVYPHWLIHHFLGELVQLGHKFVVNRKAISSHGSKTGYLSEKELEELLQSIDFKPSTTSSSADPKLEKFLRSFFFKPNTTSSSTDHKLEPIETLKCVLVKLDLCYTLKDESPDAHYFMPSIIKEGTDPQSSGKALSWESVDDRRYNYFGFRLQCEDQRKTSLSSAFFTRLQIVLRNKVKANSSFTAVVNSARGYSTFSMDGHEIIMEESSQSRVVGSHVDILVKGSGSKKKDEAVKFVMKHIINEIRAFCASSQGCQGVTLVLGVIRTNSVELLIPCEQRDEKQVVLVEVLKQQLKRNIEAHLDEDEYTDEQSLLNYEHVWEEVPEAHLPRRFESARNLLLESEVESILRAVQEERKERLQNWTPSESTSDY